MIAPLTGKDGAAMAPEQLIAIAELLAESGAASAATLEARLSLPAGALQADREALQALGLRYCAMDDHWGWPRAPQWLSLERLKSQARQRAPRLEVHYARLMGSTNDVAWARARRNGAPQLVLAEGQVAGRGRRGRHWRSPLGSGLYLSLAWPLAPDAVLAGASLAVGVATVETLQRFGAPGLALKWPNDIVHSQGKVGGILLELQQQGSARWLILGLGLNVMPLPAASDQALGLRALGLQTSREDLLEALFSAVLDELQAFLRVGLVPALRERYQALDAYQGAFVQAELGNDRIEGRYQGINEEGLLVLETAAGQRVLGHGEVSLRRLEGARTRYV